MARENKKAGKESWWNYQWGSDEDEKTNKAAAGTHFISSLK
jgi:hypothetical protein